ncbi:MAG: NADH-quinone oxidoreductase subunit F, partial [Desulfovibrio sp.]|nr:NADH-quinone oxidoreductase subunit F [Desulfovibrio sp.]
MGPLVICYPGGDFYVRVEPKDADEIITKTIIEGVSVERLQFKGDAGVLRKTANDVQFYHLQQRLVLRNCGHINPEDIEEYIANDGYRGLVKALEIGRMAALEEVKKSGLRGRGGAGFPTGKKWELTIPSEGEPKYMLCNADEGDPGAFMDRSILEGDPHAVIEGMLIGAYVVGCTEGYVYVRAEYPLAIHRLKIAIAQAEEKGFLGKNIFGSGFDFKLEIKFGAGA